MTGTVGIVLAGGRSERMGTPKAGLDWRGVPLLAHVAAIVGRATGRVVVVGALGQQLPPLPPGVAVVRDAVQGRGPLEGIRAGLAAAEPGERVAYVSAVDVPLLRPELVARVLAAVVPGVDAAVPSVDGRLHPLAGAYRVSLLPEIARRVADGRLRVASLAEGPRVARLDREALLADPALAAADPALESLRNLNAPADYAAACATAPQAMREKATSSPVPAPPDGTHASAVAPVRDVIA
jgi:molybdopterin-guanine dinucleotide biosynthesis protein A